jgi:hypothetical protein
MLSLCFWDEKQSWSFEEFMKQSMSLWSSMKTGKMKKEL